MQPPIKCHSHNSQLILAFINFEIIVRSYNYSQQNQNKEQLLAPLMSQEEIQWSRLLRKQDEYVHTLDQQENKFRKNLKHLYKQQLDQMIQQQRRNANNQKEQDLKLVEYSKRVELAKELEQQEKNNHIQKINSRMARDNLKSVENKKRKYRMETEGLRNFYNHRFDKIHTEIEEEEHLKQKKREQEKKSLSIAYDEQMTEHDLQRRLDKQEDEKMMKLLREIQEKKQRDRQQYFRKIRNYHQNPEVYDNVKTIINNKERNRSQFLDKMASFNGQQESEKRQTIQEQQKQRQKRLVSQFNHQYDQEKKKRERHQSMKEVSEFHQRYKKLEEQIRREAQQKEREEEHKRQLLKQQLQHQIQDIEKKKRKRNQLDTREFELNKSGQVPALPGLWRDHASEKHHKIIQNFLKGKSNFL